MLDGVGSIAAILSAAGHFFESVRRQELQDADAVRRKQEALGVV